MTPKQYLQQYRDMESRINDSVSEIARLRSLATKCTTAFGGVGGSGSCNSDSIPRYVARIIDIENKTNADIDAMLAIRDDIIATIESIPDERYRRILRLRYISGQKWETVAELTDYSTRHVVHVLHPQALAAVNKIIGGTEK